MPVLFGSWAEGLELAWKRGDKPFHGGACPLLVHPFLALRERFCIALYIGLNLRKKTEIVFLVCGSNRRTNKQQQGNGVILHGQSAEINDRASAVIKRSSRLEQCIMNNQR